MKKLIAGNWKMNKTTIEAKALIEEILKGSRECKDAELLVCPPYTQLYPLHEILRESAIYLGAQDCSNYEEGAYTGQISAMMLKDIGCSYVILGHSERRAYNKEDDLLVSKKLKVAQTRGLKTIVCIGESLEDREKGKHNNIVRNQLDKSISGDVILDHLIIAYEPIWAIGTGKTATSEDIQSMHQFIFTYLKERFGMMGEGVRILYGGSVKPSNAADILSIDHVGGALIGGASLNADDFLAIYHAVFRN